MHEYLMEIDYYFIGARRFQVTALNKADAMERAKEAPIYKDREAIKSSLRVVRKLKPSFGERGIK